MNIIAATALAGNFRAAWALLAGLLGGVAFLAVVTMGRAIGMTRMNFLEVLGTMVAPDATRATVYATGLAAHLMASAGFGLAHAGLLRAVGATSVGPATASGLAPSPPCPPALRSAPPPLVGMRSAPPPDSGG